MLELVICFEEKIRYSILIANGSITYNMLIKSILTKRGGNLMNEDSRIEMLYLIRNFTIKIKTAFPLGKRNKTTIIPYAMVIKNLFTLKVKIKSSLPNLAMKC